MNRGIGSAAERERLAAIQAALRASGLAAAAAQAERALADGIEHPLPISVLAANHETEGRFEEALALLRRAKALAPTAVNVLNGLGLSLARLGRLEEAIAEYDEALAAQPGYGKAMANRGMALIALSRLGEARRDLEAALAGEPDNLTAQGGLAALALRRGETGEARRRAEAILKVRPGLAGAALVLAEAEVADGEAGRAEARLQALLDGPVGAVDRALAWGLLGDALDRQRRHGEAFAAWSRCNALLLDRYRADHDGTAADALVRGFAQALRGRSIARAGSDAACPARAHVFLVGFPRSGTTLLKQVLEEHPEVVTLAERECLAEAGAHWLGDAARFAGFLDATEAALAPLRDAYWRRVSAEGAAPAGKVFVDKHPFNTLKLPLIARLFPDARILFARRDPRDTILSCFRHRFRMSGPVYRMLTLEGAAALYDAAMTLADASAQAFGLGWHDVALERMIADFEGETRAICAYLGVEWSPTLAGFSAHVAGRDVATPSGPQLVKGLNAGGVGRWRDYEAQMMPILSGLTPWIERFGHQPGRVDKRPAAP